MSRYPVAFVDESFLDRQGHPGFYLLAATIIEGPDLDTTIAAARAASTDTEFHAAILHHRGHMRAIEDMLDTVEQHAAWTAVVVHTPLGPAKEVARQTSLRQLLTYLDRQRVRDVILDTRGAPTDWADASAKGQRRPEIDRRDLRTYRHLVTNREISSRMRLVHVDDRTQPGLWLADAVSWATQRAINATEPQWWLRVADAATILEAVTGKELLLNDNRAAPPNNDLGERGPHEPGQSAQAVLLSTPEYATPTPPESHNPIGPYLAHLVEQSERARAGGDLPYQLLAAVRDVTASVNKLITEIKPKQGMAPAQPPTPRVPQDPSPVPSDPIQADPQAPEIS